MTDFTKNELQILGLFLTLVNGKSVLTNQQIAYRLDITETTVKWRTKSIARKFGVANQRAAIILRAIGYFRLSGMIFSDVCQ